jgi:hypothetical protein
MSTYNPISIARFATLAILAVIVGGTSGCDLNPPPTFVPLASGCDTCPPHTRCLEVEGGVQCVPPEWAADTVDSDEDG